MRDKGRQVSKSYFLYIISAYFLSTDIVTFLPYFTFTSPFLYHNYLISLLQGHMVVHAHHCDSFTSLSMTHSFLIYDSIIIIRPDSYVHDSASGYINQ